MIVQACLTLPDLAHEQNPSQLHTSAITPRTGLHTHTLTPTQPLQNERDQKEGKPQG